MSVPLPPRYLSLWLRRLATDRLRHPASAPDEDRPLVVTALVKSALRIVAMNDAAHALGLRSGMPLADARAMYPALAVAPNDPEADRRLVEAVADWCDRYTPLIGIDAPFSLPTRGRGEESQAPDGLVLDITGCAHLFGGEAALARNLLARLAAQGLHARAAIADTVGCAHAVARYGTASVVPPKEMRRALLALPVAALRLAPETVEALAELGLKRIADLIDLPRAPLAARFGELLRRLDQALGREDEPIAPRLPVPAYVAEQRFSEPIALERDVLGTIARLAEKLGAAMEQRQDGARLLQVALFRTDRKVFRIEVGTAAPVRDAARIARLFADRLAAIGDDCDPGFGFDIVRLAALVAERSEPVQAVLQGGLGQGGFAEEEFSHLIDRLGARFGLRRVTRLVEQDTHIPEFAVAAVPAHAVRRRLSSPSPRVRGEGRGEGLSPQAQTRGKAPSPALSPHSPSKTGRGEDQDTLALARPIRLFGRPELVDAIAQVPDGPPVRFRWRRVLHEVAAAEGPERIAMEWWRDAEGAALTRDYFRVESREGLRVWLYREGLYGRETAAPRWFLHGVFG
jgi:protein ImuB